MSHLPQTGRHFGPSRREFLLSTALAVTASATSASEPKLMASPFPLTAIRLLDGPQRTAMELNRTYMLKLESERLLHNFRTNAGLISGAKPLGGWETPDVELRGHFTGHYLSACALMWASTGDKVLKLRGDGMVGELAKCQARLGNGYLSAFPVEFFDRLREGKKVWVPWYAYHKILAGMIDMYRFADNKEALQVAEGMAQWAAAWVKPLTDEQMQQILNIEFGGMNEALFELAAITGKEVYAATGKRFEHARIFNPLVQRRDDLKGLHVNTQIPKVIGAARAFEVSGETQYRQIAEFFWRQVVRQRCYTTGGTSNKEHWNQMPGSLASELSDQTQECCCTYNMLKLTRHLFRWTADPKVADYYERALFNAVLGTISPEEGTTMYFVPLASGYWKVFARPFDSFWCCTGTGIESFSKLADSIYFHDDKGIWLNLFVASELTWDAKGVKLKQLTRFPDEQSSSVTITVPQPTRFELRIRVPHWVSQDFKVHVNGSPVEAAWQPSSYFILDRLWRSGDKVDINIPMELRTEGMPDDPQLQSILYGPLVLAGDLGSAGLNPDSYRGTLDHTVKNHYLKGDPVPAPELKSGGQPVSKWVRKDPAAPLRFRAATTLGDVALMPLNRILKQRYAVYWRVS